MRWRITSASIASSRAAANKLDGLILKVIANEWTARPARGRKTFTVSYERQAIVHGDGCTWRTAGAWRCGTKSDSVTALRSVVDYRAALGDALTIS